VKNILIALTFSAAATSLSAQHENHNHAAAAPAPKVADFRLKTETHLKNLRQLTFGGDNAEAFPKQFQAMGC